MDDLQRLIDRLARELDRGVMLEDRRQRLIAHSAHNEDTDPLRREAILHRQSPKAVREWLHSLGVDSLVTWQRIPANAALGMEQRVCVPVRFQESLLGHLWIIEAEEMQEGELSLASRGAEEAAAILYRTRLVLQVESGQEREGLRDLLSDTEAVRRQARIHMVEADLIRPHAGIGVVVCSSTHDNIEFDDVERAQLDGCLHTVRTTVDRRDLLYLIRPDHALCLVSSARGERARHIEATAARLQAELQRTFVGSRCAPMVTTVGGIKTGLDQAWSSYDEALRTARVVQAFPSLGDLASWERLGVYRLLSNVAQDQIDARLLHPGVVALMNSKDAAERLRLVEVYLDSNADAGRTAEIMDIHRTSVYYRLGRIEEVMGVSLNDGLEKLGVHISVKLLRLGAPSGSAPGASQAP
jgi:sugar diacid utilization regulator